MKFPHLRLKSAKYSDRRSVKRLFSRINKSIKTEEVEDLIAEKKVFVLKDRKKKIKAAFSYTIFTIAGFFIFIYIGRIAVDPNLEGQGIGSFLLSQIRNRSLKIGATAFFLYSVSQAKKFYEKNKLKGFWRIFWWRNETV